MPYGYSRTDRIAEQIQRILAVLIRDRVKDPRVKMLTLLDVKVSKDFAYAKIYFDVFQAESAKEITTGLNRAAKFLRRELGRAINLRKTPALTFIYDDTQEQGRRLSKLIDQAIASDKP